MHGRPQIPGEMALTKNDLIEAVSDKLDYPNEFSKELVEKLLEMMKGELESGKDVLVSGFGKFSVMYKNGRRGRNPQTGEDLMLRPRRVVTFKASRKLNIRANLTDEPFMEDSHESG